MTKLASKSLQNELEIGHL